MDYMSKLGDDIKKTRNIKESSLRVYLFNILKLHDKIFDNKHIKDIKWLVEHEKVMNAIKDMKLSSRKTYLASIVVSLLSQQDDKLYEESIKYYRDVMEKLGKEYNLQQDEQKKSMREEKNWTTLKQLRKIMMNYKREIREREILKKTPNNINNKEFDLLQKWVTSALYVLEDSAPLRNDYIMIVITNDNYNKLSDDQLKNQNYLVIKSKKDKFFSLGEYKTSQKYGLKKIEISDKLNAILNIWLKYNTSGHLLLNSKKEPMTSNGITKLLNKVFEPTNKKISSSMIRHIFISETIGGPSLKEKQNLADKMGHSVSEQEKYKRI